MRTMFTYAMVMKHHRPRFELQCVERVVEILALEARSECAHTVRHVHGKRIDAPRQQTAICARVGISTHARTTSSTHRRPWQRRVRDSAGTARSLAA
jgi:hypothetical protein